MPNTLLAILIGSVIGVLLVLAGSTIMSAPDKRSKQNVSAPPQEAEAQPVSFVKKHGCLLQLMLIAAVAGGMIGCIAAVALTNPVVAKDALIGGAILGGIGLLLTFFVAAL